MLNGWVDITHSDHRRIGAASDAAFTHTQLRLTIRRSAVYPRTRRMWPSISTARVRTALPTRRKEQVREFNSPYTSCPAPFQQTISSGPVPAAPATGTVYHQRRKQVSSYCMTAPRTTRSESTATVPPGPQDGPRTNAAEPDLRE